MPGAKLRRAASVAIESGTILSAVHFDIASTFNIRRTINSLDECIPANAALTDKYADKFFNLE
jgi:hypothetical protein